MQRALNDDRYARDLLLVCDAMKDTDLPLLARQFRAADRLMADERREHRLRAGRDAGPPQDWAADTSGFGVTHPPAAAEPANQGAKAPWFSPSRWF